MESILHVFTKTHSSQYTVVVGRIMLTQIYLNPNSQNLWICCVTWQRRIQVVNGIKVVNQLTLNEEFILDYQCNQVFKCGGGRPKRSEWKCGKNSTCHCWLSHRGSSYITWGMQAAFRSWKEPGKDSPWSSKKGMGPAAMLIFTQRKLCQISDLQNCKIRFTFFQATEILVICYNGKSCTTVLVSQANLTKAWEFFIFMIMSFIFMSS
jgi:hypothetical protein